MIEPRSRGVLDAPPSRGMTTVGWASRFRSSRYGGKSPLTTTPSRRRNGPALMRHQQSPDLRSRYRRAEQKTLHLRAAELAQHLALPFLLDAFRRRRHVAGGGDFHDGLNDRGRRPLAAAAVVACA